MAANNDIVEALDALAHETRLDVFVALVEAGPDGLSAGTLADRVGVAPSALSFHLNRLRHAGLATSRRQGQRVVYAARFDRAEDLMTFLSERCCERSAESCTPACETRRASRRGKRAGQS